MNKASNLNLTNEELSVVTYQYLDTHDIHEITILKPSRLAIDEMFAILSNIFTQYADQSQLQIMIVQGKQISPIRHFFSSAQQFLREHPNRPVTRTIVLHQRGQYLNFLDTFIRLLRMPDKIRYIEYAQRDKAIQWLTSLRD